MKNHLNEHIISATWLGILGYLFIYSSTFLSPDTKSNLLVFFSIVMSAFLYLIRIFPWL
jgi:hypothetical protein